MKTRRQTSLPRDISVFRPFSQAEDARETNAVKLTQVVVAGALVVLLVAALAVSFW